MTAYFIISLVLLSYYAATHISDWRLLPSPQENGPGRGDAWGCIEYSKVDSIRNVESPMSNVRCVLDPHNTQSGFVGARHISILQNKAAFYDIAGKVEASIEIDILGIGASKSCM